MAKPSFLGLLNAIAVAEERGEALLKAWSAVTESKEVRATLEFVAAREREHAAAFAKRISELGYSVRATDDPAHAKRLKKARSGATDRKKFKKVLGYGPTPAQDPFGALFDDQSIDPQTGALLGRFIAEERDSGRRLQACYDALCAKPAQDHADHEVLQDLATRLDRLSATLDDLKQLREVP